MEIYQSVILGMVQGLTELLPISSSAHLNIIPWMFGWINNPGFTEAFEGFDVALEMSGNGGALNQLIHSMRNGGKVALLGIAGPGTVVDWNEIIFKGLNIQGIYGRKMFETWYKMGAMVQAGLDLTPMVTHRFNYRDFEKGFEAMNSGSSGKVVLDWTK